MSEIEYLDLDDVIDLARALLGDPPPFRDVGLLGSAVARPATSAFGADAYPDVWSKAAALMQSLVINHAVVDGNRCLGWLSTAVFLQLNGVDIVEASNDAVDLVMWVVSGNPQLESIVDRLHGLI